MLLIRHRINTIEETVPSEYGIEFDIRDGLIVTHDHRGEGPSLDNFLKHHTNQAFYIVNIKCEGIESEVLALLKQHGIERFFLLDCSFPMIVRLSNQGETRLAVRYSEYESVQTVLAMKNRVEWVWVDCFTTLPTEIDRLRKEGFKLCLVSPELQGRYNEIEEYATKMKNGVDAVCTKFPVKWL
jgi:hypothetical protein